MSRPRKPTAIKMKDGSYRKDRANNEPMSSSLSTLDAPEFLDEHAVRVWAELAPVFVDLGTLTAADVAAFGDLCQARADYLRLSGWIRSQGGEGEVTPTILTERERRLQYATKMLNRFGGNPSDRAKIDLPQSDDDDDIRKQLGL